MVGLSLSFCVQDVVEGRVCESDIEWIEAGTKVPEGGWPRILAEYADVYWRKAPQAGIAVACRLIAAGKVQQPRLRGVEARNIASGHWLRDGVLVPRWA